MTQAAHHAGGVPRPERPGGVVAVDAPRPGAFGLLPGTVELVQDGEPHPIQVLAWGDPLQVRLPPGAAGLLRIVPAAPLEPFETNL